MFLDVHPKLRTKPFGEIWAWSFCKVGVINIVSMPLSIDKGEWVESISKGETSNKEFLALVDESIMESNRGQFLNRLNNKTKLTIYKTFGGEVKFKRYLNGVGDAGTRLLFKLRSGTHGLNEELGKT